jgi:hypothetical protein
VATPDVVLRYNDSFSALFERCWSLAPVRCAVVHPCDEASLRGAIEAARLGLLEPVLVGPEARIRNLAIATGINLAATPLVAVEHSHAAAERAVALARSGDVGG